MVVSFALAVPLGRLYTHQLYLAITGVLSWDQALPVGDELKQHLMWLKHYVPAHNGNHWFRRIPGVVLVSDVSVKGVGGIAATSGSNNESVVHVALQSQIPVELQVASSTCREAVGVLSLFSTLLQQPTWAALLKHRAVKILTDNQGVAADIQRMQVLASLWESCSMRSVLQPSGCCSASVRVCPGGCPAWASYLGYGALLTACCNHSKGFLPWRLARSAAGNK
jgi:hypothetical protein